MNKKIVAIAALLFIPALPAQADAAPGDDYVLRDVDVAVSCDGAPTLQVGVRGRSVPMRIMSVSVDDNLNESWVARRGFKNRSFPVDHGSTYIIEAGSVEQAFSQHHVTIDCQLSGGDIADLSVRTNRRCSQLIITPEGDLGNLRVAIWGRKSGQYARHDTQVFDQRARIDLPEWAARVTVSSQAGSGYVVAEILIDCQR